MKIWFIPKTQGGACQQVCTTEDALCGPSAKQRAGASLAAFADAAELRAGSGQERTASRLLPGCARSNSLAVSTGAASRLRGEGGVLRSSGSQSGVFLAEVAASSWDLVRKTHSRASDALGAGPGGLSPPGDSDAHSSSRITGNGPRSHMLACLLTPWGLPGASCRADEGLAGQSQHPFQHLPLNPGLGISAGKPGRRLLCQIPRCPQRPQVGPRSAAGKAVP